MELIQVYVI